MAKKTPARKRTKAPRKKTRVTKPRKGKQARKTRVAKGRKATPDDQARFLDAYAKVATITGACQNTGVGRRTHYHWMEADEDYAERWREADEEATERLEQEARRRALVGTDKPVFYQGEPCGAIREYSDTLLIFLLKGKKPEVYRDRYEITGKGGGAIEVARIERVIVDGADPQD